MEYKNRVQWFVNLDTSYHSFIDQIDKISVLWLKDYNPHLRWHMEHHEAGGW